MTQQEADRQVRHRLGSPALVAPKAALPIRRLRTSVRRISGHVSIVLADVQYLN
jgi:hypothetical protein